MAYIIAQPCIGVKTGACAEICPVDGCIRAGQDQMYIDPTLCIDCGACEPECPVEAIFEAEHTPEAWKGYVEKNTDFFVRQRKIKR